MRISNQLRKYTRPYVKNTQSTKESAEQLVFDLENDAREELIKVLEGLIISVRYHAKEVRKLKRRLHDAQSRVKQLEKELSVAVK